MQPTSRSLYLLLRGLVLVLTATLALSSMVAEAQQGDNAVWSSTVQGSAAWVDVTAFSGTDMCVIINDILTSASTFPTYPASGEVIDARGYSGGTSVACSVNPFLSVSVPSTILLPSANINIQSPWTLPSNTRLIGEGRTTILVDDTGQSSGDMVQMAPSSACSSAPCFNISLEHLKLMGSGSTNLNGIVNYNAQNGSYVNDVELIQIGGVGLLITSGAKGSGPYSNINFNANTSAASPACVEIQAEVQGLHGITCIGSANVSVVGQAGIYLDASNTTIEDVHIEGFWDGIQVGDIATATNNTIANVQGSSTGSGVKVNTVVHICGPNHQTFTGACANTSETVTDLTVLQARNPNGGTCSVTLTDDVTGTVTTLGGGTSVAIYALGDAVSVLASDQFSRFVSSPTMSATASCMPSGSLTSSVIPTWGVGNGTVSHTCTNSGLIYSNTAGTGTSDSIYVCTNGTWTSIF
jgi:hypothetical protein